ncbi:MAG TPA: mechanosensitive ion channel domain-containing protein, partial [Acidobacteriota bacterium]|nr:mechanosensitive ion channel domain-containing protein [Acidobacteriota bacterium]
QVVTLNEAAIRSLLDLNAIRSLQEVREQSSEAARQVPELAEIAAEVEGLAEMLWGAEGIVVRSESTARALAVTGKNVSDLSRLIQLTIRKFQAFGRRGSISRWWPAPPEDFAKPGDIAKTIRELEWRVPEAQHDLIRFEQERLEVRELRAKTLAGLRVVYPGEGGRENRNIARKLLSTRRQLLDRLIELYGRYSSQLIELQTVSRHFLSEVNGITSFLYEQLLWVRSVPRPIVPQAGDVFDALLWLISPAEWAAALGAVYEGFAEFSGKGLGSVLVLLLLIGLRQWMRRRIIVLAKLVSNPLTDTYRATLETLAYTLLLAAPLPLILYLAGGFLSRAASSPFLFSTAEALGYFVSIVALFEVIRQSLVPGGLSEAHFGWPSAVTRPIHRGLLIAEAVFLPPIYFAIRFAMAGIKFSSPDDLQVYNNSLGRIIFVAAMGALGFFLLGLFRPRKRASSAADSEHSSRLHRIYMYAYPVIVLTTLAPAVLAILGYYVTAFLLAYQMLRTLWLVVGLSFLSSLLLRWRTWSQRETSSGTQEQAEGVAGSTLPGAEAQVRALFRFVVVLFTVLGCYSIWADAVPTLQMLKRVQVWPTITLLEDKETANFYISGQDAAERAVSTTAGTSASDSKTAAFPLSPAGTESSAETAGEDAGSPPLTLWSVLKALLAFVITWVLVKNVPGLLELILQKRSLLDLGARIALGTLVRYAIIIFGVSASFSLLGISWTKIQWLAAALTFGLGFGLQEIVANFVSGLILLTERPVRVGDAVSIGNLQGRVTRIQIRSTTVTLWDRSEMIVPNKEFVTSKLINWTLSDSKRRMDIPLYVIYGSDLEKIKKALLDVARSNPNVLEEPPPQALILEFGEGAIKLELRIFVEFGNGLVTKDAVQMEVDRVFRERGIEFATPKLNIGLLGREHRKQKVLEEALERDLFDGREPAT